MSERSPSTSRIVLIGMMGAGKTVAGRAVASRLGWPHLDSDEQIQQKTGHTVAQIFAQRGEAAFRAEESQAMVDAVAVGGPLVFAVAGGAVLSAGNRRLLRGAGLIVWLRAELATLARRVEDGDHRPLLAGDRLAQLTTLYAERRPFYEELADVVIDVDHLTPAQVADQVVAAFDARQARSDAKPLPPDGSPTVVPARGGRGASPAGGSATVAPANGGRGA